MAIRHKKAELEDKDVTINLRLLQTKTKSYANKMKGAFEWAKRVGLCT